MRRLVHVCSGFVCLKGVLLVDAEGRGVTVITRRVAMGCDEEESYYDVLFMIAVWTLCIERALHCVLTPALLVFSFLSFVGVMMVMRLHIEIGGYT
jgi:hypothetical protein